jgi:hypothetical protein
MTLTRDDVATHIRSEGAVQWTTLANVLVTGVQSCVDGREPDAVLGTPGGDAGEYLVHLAAIEALTGVEIPDDEIPEVFQRFLKHFGRFYMHTDTHALENLRKAVVADKAIDAAPADLAAAEKLVRTPGKLAEALLPHVLAADNIGCGHLKLIVKNPEEYGVRPQLARKFLETVFRAIWAGGDIDYTVLEGGHAEGAVVQVTAGKKKHAYTRIPMVAPCSHGQQMFVQHPKVVAWLRHQMATFLGEVEPLLEGVDTDDFTHEVRKLADQQLGATLQHLASGLPLYQALVNEAGSVVVTGNDVI